MNKTKTRIAYLLLWIAAIAIAAHQLPAYASRLPWLMLVAACDLYLYYFFSNPFLFRNPISRSLLIFFTFLPSFLLICFLLSMAFISPVGWHPFVRTYLLGLAVFFYILRIFPLLVLIPYNVKTWIIKKRKKTLNSPSGLVGWLKISFGLSSLTGFIMILGMTMWVYDFEVVKKEIRIDGLPSGFEGYRILHFSDLHLGRWHSPKPMQRAFDLINEQQPDIIVFTGDLVNYSTEEALPHKDLLSGLTAKDGVFAVLGNHDYGDYMRWPDTDAKQENIRQMYDLIEEVGWVLLENENVSIYRHEHCLTLAGIANYSATSHYPDRSDLNLALAGIPDSCIVILLTHNPVILTAEKHFKKPVGLVLAGHTHASQISLKFGTREYSPSALIYKYWAGLHNLVQDNGQVLKIYVNRGLGHIAFPFRIGARPEITLLVLTQG